MDGSRQVLAATRSENLAVRERSDCFNVTPVGLRCFTTARESGDCTWSVSLGESRSIMRLLEVWDSDTSACLPQRWRRLYRRVNTSRYVIGAGADPAIPCHEKARKFTCGHLYEQKAIESLRIHKCCSNWQVTSCLRLPLPGKTSQS